MSTPPSPATQLLSAERLAEINDEREAAFECAVQNNLNAAGRQYLRDTRDLLADRAAYRLLVAQELAGLLLPEPTEAEYHSERGSEAWAAAEAIRRNKAVKELATRLGLDLSTLK